MAANRYRLVIGNKNWSSWSLRPWLAMRRAGVAFDEINVRLRLPESKAEILKHSPFADRNALVERALDTWEHAVVDDVIARIENTDHNDARTKLRHLFSLARDYARADQGLAVELAIRDWARRSPGVSERLHRVDATRAWAGGKAGVLAVRRQ